MKKKKKKKKAGDSSRGPSQQDKGEVHSGIMGVPSLAPSLRFPCPFDAAVCPTSLPFQDKVGTICFLCHSASTIKEGLLASPYPLSQVRLRIARLFRSHAPPHPKDGDGAQSGVDFDVMTGWPEIKGNRCEYGMFTDSSS